METSILISRIIEIVYLSFGLGFLINRSYSFKELPKLIDNSSYLILGAMMTIVSGILIVTYYNIWIDAWSIVISLIGWIALVKGVVLLVFPNIKEWYKPMLNDQKVMTAIGSITLILGLVFCYYGFMM